MRSTTVHSPTTDIYKYYATLKFVLENEVYDIDDISIKTIVIDNNYDELNMPMIFITLGIYKSMANKMILNQQEGTFILDIKRCVANSDMPELFSDYINDKFIYFIAGEVDQGIDVDIEKSDVQEDDTIVTVGLLCLDHVNKNKKTMNGIVNGNLSSLMYYATSHLPILIEPPKNNVTFENRILPPMNSVAKTLKYLNSLSVFYPTPYRFFIDFDRSYLISSSGKPIKASGDDITSVMITMYHIDEQEAKIQGMITNNQQSLYEIIVNSADCELSDDNISEKSFNKITANTDSGQLSSTLSTANSSLLTSKTKTIRIGNGNTGLIDNMVSSLDTSAIQLLVQKVDIDGSIFTINKEYIIRAEHAYNTEKYNGKYLLVRKRELYIRNDDTFTMNIMLLFKKIPE